MDIKKLSEKELEQSITDITELANAASTSAEEKEALMLSVSKFQEELASREADDSKAKPKPTPPAKPTPKKINKREIYAELKKKYPHLTKEVVGGLSARAFTTNKNAIGATIMSMGDFAEKEARSIAELYLTKHAPKGLSVEADQDKSQNKIKGKSIQRKIEVINNFLSRKPLDKYQRTGQNLIPVFQLDNDFYAFNVYARNVGARIGVNPQSFYGLGLLRAELKFDRSQLDKAVKVSTPKKDNFILFDEEVNKIAETRYDEDKNENVLFRLKAKFSEKSEKLSYKKPISRTSLEKMPQSKLDCIFHKEVVTERRELEMLTVAEPGDVILYKEDGHPFTIIKKEPASQMCHLPSVKEGNEAKKIQEELDDLKAEYSSYRKKTVPKVTFDEQVAEIAELKQKLKAHAAKLSQPKPTPPKPQPSPAKTTSKAAPKVAKKSASQATKTEGCTTEQRHLAKLVGQMQKFLSENIYTGVFKSRTIEGIYRRTKDDGSYEVVVKVKSYALKNRDEWFSICTKTMKQTAIDKPKNGTIRILVPKEEIKTLYTTTKKGVTKRNAKTVYQGCLKIYRNFYECQKNGTCTAKDKEALSEAYRTCGDLHKRFDKTPEWMEKARKEVHEKKKKDENFWKAWRRIFK